MTRRPAAKADTRDNIRSTALFLTVSGLCLIAASGHARKVDTAAKNANPAPQQVIYGIHVTPPPPLPNGGGTPDGGGVPNTGDASIGVLSIAPVTPVAASVDASDAPAFLGKEPGQPRIVLHLVMSQWLTNCYVLIGKTNKAIVIDPADWLTALPNNGWDTTGTDMKLLDDALRLNHLDVQYIISTHGHLDHVSGTRELKKLYPNAKFCMAGEDIDAAGRPKDSHMFPDGLPKVDQKLVAGDTVRCDGMILKVLQTPGHSPGSLCLRSGDWLFSGDTLFYHSVGRTNFLDGSGNWDNEMNSIRTKLYCLPPATLVMPGHLGFTTIGEEKANNPFTTAAPVAGQ